VLGILELLKVIDKIEQQHVIRCCPLV
jgi:hypothetical protein